ncbi:MAG: MAC/perforin domain-containing protein [Litoreibacter sp.]
MNFKFSKPFQKIIIASFVAGAMSSSFAVAEDYVLNNRSGLSLDVFKKDKSGKETYLKTIFDSQAEQIEAMPDDILTFKTGAENDHDGVDQIKIREGKTIYELKMVRKTADSLPASYKSIPNFDPNLHSYDIFYVDPFHIDNSEAKKGLVFERLDVKGRDYVVQDGNLYHKVGFNFLAVDTGWGTTETEYHSSTRSFLDKFSFGITLGASKGSKDNKAKGSLGGSYSEMTKNVTKDKRAWTTSRQDIVKYEVSTVGNEQRLAPGFIQAVVDLPVAYNEKKYRAFIEAWGTHYPKKIQYGGMYLGIRSMTETQVIDTIEEGWDIKLKAAVPVKGVTGTGELDAGRKTIKTTSDLDRHSISKYQYRGGTGGKDGWTVTDGAQPVNASLNRLHELLDSKRISAALLPSDDLLQKKKNLETAITNYIGTAVDVNSFSIKPRVYEIHWVELYANDLDDNKDAIFGNVTLKQVGGLEKQEGSHSNVLWTRSDAGGSRVNMNAGQNYSDRYPGAFDNKSQRFVVRPGPNGDYDVTNKGVEISAKMMDYDKSSANDTIGNNKKTVYLKDFKAGKETTLVLNDGGSDDTNENGKITLTFKIQQINTEFDKLYSE